MVGALLVFADASITVTLNQQGQALAQEFQASIQQIEDKVKAGIDSDYRTARLPELLRAIANTAAFSDRALGVAYLVDKNDILFGVAATGALTNDPALGTGAVVGGAIVNFGVTGAVNLGRWDHPEWTVFANGFYEATTIHGLEGHLTTTGVHAQRTIVPGSGHWTGVAATTGFEYARWTVGEVAPILTHFEITGNIAGQVKRIGYKAMGRLDVRANTYAIPLEVTTGALLGPLGVYAGGGVDLTLGSSVVTIGLDGDLLVDSDTNPIGTANITASGTENPDLLSVHALAGLELHTRHVRFYVQGAISPSEDVVSVGLRFAP